jgi:hypothetical protein
MKDKKNHDEHLERITNQLAESVLGLSDQAILAETSEAGTDPEQEAEATRLVLRQASKALDNVNKRLSNLGHTINPNHWWPGPGEYHNNCLNCGSLVSLKTATGEMQGDAFDSPCPESGQYAIRRREASRK